MKDFDLSITICSWNTLADTRACLESLDVVRHEGNIEVIVVDNGSADGSPEMIREFGFVRLIALTENLGFTGGHNRAIAEARGRHVMLLNSDTIMHSGSVRGLLQAIAENPTAGIFGAKLLNPDGSLQYSCRRFPNPIAALFRNTPLGKLFPNNRFTREYLMQDFAHDQQSAVDWVSGAALVVTEPCLEKVKGLDPEFFMFCEDVDICWRAKENGFQTLYVPNAVITHKIGGSTSQVANKMIVRFHKSMFMFFRKHQVGQITWVLRPFALIGAAAALCLRASLYLTKNLWDSMRWKQHR